MTSSSCPPRTTKATGTVGSTEFLLNTSTNKKTPAGKLTLFSLRKMYVMTTQRKRLLKIS